MSRPPHLRSGIDPLVDPRGVADLAAALMSPRDRMLIFLVDRSLVGHLCVAVDLDHGVAAFTHVFASVTDATRGTTLSGLVIVERAVDSLHLDPVLVSRILDAHHRGPRVEAWIRFDRQSVYDVWPLIGPDVTSLMGPDVAP